MISLEKHLPEGTRLGTVLHIGAGDGSSIDSYLALAPQRLILVEGDPVTSAALEERAKTLPNANVIARPVSAEGGSLRWHRFNLAFLNGPLVPIGLSAVYPRLRPAETITVESIAITQLIVAQDITQDPDHVNLLVLDVPGQETALLAALPQPLLSSFALIMVRSCQPGTFADASSMESAIESFTARYFRPISRSNDEPTWPQLTLRFDALACERDSFERQLSELKAREVETSRTIDAMRVQLDELQKSKRTAENLAEARANEIEILKRERDEATSLVQNFQLTTREQESRLAQAKAALAADREALERTIAELRTELRSSQQAKAEIEKLATQRQTQAEQVSKDKTLLVAARDEQTRLAAERLRTIERLEREVSELTARHSMLKEELVKSEAHVELIADLLLAEARL
jgi:FkbM family methyltransferase